MFSVSVMCAVWRREEVNKEIPEDDLIGDRNMSDYFLKVF